MASPLVSPDPEHAGLYPGRELASGSDGSEGRALRGGRRPGTGLSNRPGLSADALWRIPLGGRERGCTGPATWPVARRGGAALSGPH